MKRANIGRVIIAWQAQSTAQQDVFTTHHRLFLQAQASLLLKTKMLPMSREAILTQLCRTSWLLHSF